MIAKRHEMIDHAGFRNRSARLSEALRAHMGVRGCDLGTQLCRVRRRLPRRLRTEADRLIQAEAVIAHPKLARLLPMGTVQRAFEAIEAHLARIDPAQRRRDALLRVLGVAVFNLLLFAVLLWAFLRWHGGA